MTLLNLVTEAWLPVRRASGARARIAPGEVTDDRAGDPIVALDFPREDWNAAVGEWLIGLLQLAMPAADDAHWGELFRAPPSPSVLSEAFAPLAPAFELGGEGPRAFQDFEALPGEPRPLPALLIDAPGEKTARLNTDLFVKRGWPQALSVPFAAAALITLQTYAPSGGKGHRTSLRGGGPLTLLLVPSPTERRPTLWETLWANTPGAGWAKPPAVLSAALPWLSTSRTSSDEEAVGPHDAHPALAFFACPRRIRLIFSDARCGISGVAGSAVTGFTARPYGPNYRDWRHPLSPYRRDARGALVPLHAAVESFDASSFAAWWGLQGAAALAPEAWVARRRYAGGEMDARLSAYGYDMANMKARQWLQRELPWRDLSRPASAETIRRAAEALGATGRSLGHAVKIARFGQADGGGYTVSDRLPRAASDAPAQALRSAVEPAFNAVTARLVETQSDSGAALKGWGNTLAGAAEQAFEDALDPVAALAANPRRFQGARKLLASALGPEGAVGRALR